jgi:hypothetical protein
MVVDDLFEDMKDGVKLLALLEVLSGQKLVRIFFLTYLLNSFHLKLGGVGDVNMRGAAHIRKRSSVL